MRDTIDEVEVGEVRGARLMCLLLVKVGTVASTKRGDAGRIKDRSTGLSRLTCYRRIPGIAGQETLDGQEKGPARTLL